MMADTRARGILTTSVMSKRQRRLLAARSKLPRRARWPRASWLMVILLAALWTALWGELTWANGVAGVLVALLVTTIVPLPRDTRSRPLVIRPIATIHLMTKFTWDVVKASAQIAWAVLIRRQPDEAILRVNLRAHSDSFLAATAALTSLVPGSIVLNIHRATGAMYVHIFDVNAAGGLAGARKAVLDQERRLMRAFATRDELLDAGLEIPHARHRRLRRSRLVFRAPNQEVTKR